MIKRNKYYPVIVESYEPSNTSGLHGTVHIRPVEGEVFPQNLHVECSKSLSNTSRYPVGTKFRIKVKLTDREGTDFLYSYHGWNYEVIK